jgi:hypothetical protein
MFYDFNIFKISNINKLQNKYYSKYLEIVNDFEKNKSKLNINYNLYNDLLILKNNNELYDDNKNGFYKLLRKGHIKLDNDFYDDFEKNKEKIECWTNNNNIKFNVFKDIYNNFVKNYINILTINSNYDLKFNELKPFDFIEQYQFEFKKSLITNDSFEKIIKPFIHSYPHHFCFNYERDDVYTSVRHFQLVNSVTGIKNKDPFLFYLYFGKLNDSSKKYYKNKISLTNDVYEMRITNKINLKLLFNTLPFYYIPSKFTTYNLALKSNHDNLNNLNNLTIKTINTPKWEYFCYKILNEISHFSMPLENTELEILSTFIKNFKQYLIKTKKN